MVTSVIQCTWETRAQSAVRRKGATTGHVALEDDQRLRSLGGWNVSCQTQLGTLSSMRFRQLCAPVCDTSLSWLQVLATLCMSDVRSVLSSTVLLSSSKLMPVSSFMESIHLILVFLFSCCLLFFPALIIFSKKPWLLRIRPK